MMNFENTQQIDLFEIITIYRSIIIIDNKCPVWPGHIKVNLKMWTCQNVRIYLLFGRYKDEKQFYWNIVDMSLV